MESEIFISIQAILLDSEIDPMSAAVDCLRALASFATELSDKQREALYSLATSLRP